MSLNSTPNGERVHIGIFGRRNAGKSSLINAITGQNLAIVSDTAGTTTDPVSKAMEILPLGPVLITDTPGFDDEGELGEQRVEKSYEVLRKVNIAIVVVSAENCISEEEKTFIENIKKRNIPFIICISKCDLYNIEEIENRFNEKDLQEYLFFTSAGAKSSAVAKFGIEDIKEKLASFNTQIVEKHVIADFVNEGDTVVLVVPIDESAPKGRLILPQQQVIRDLLEVGATAVVTRETELSDTISKLKNPPKAVITDSQAFNMVAKIVPEDVYLSSFSILMARYKGDLEWQVEGAKALDKIKDGAKILISEGCTHHRQCGDIGTVKLPKWINEYTGKKIEYEFTSGGEFPDDVSAYSLIVHCGGCTLNEQEMKYRIGRAKEAGVPITNYGIIISYINGILERSLRLLTIGDK